MIRSSVNLGNLRAYTSSAKANRPPPAASPRAATGEKKRNNFGNSSQLLRPEGLQGRAQAFAPLISSDAAKLLGSIHVKTPRRYARRGNLPGYQIWDHWVFSRLPQLTATAISHAESRSSGLDEIFRLAVLCVLWDQIAQKFLG